jgi:hypothetical protein
MSAAHSVRHFTAECDDTAYSVRHFYGKRKRGPSDSASSHVAASAASAAPGAPAGGTVTWTSD